MIRAEDLFRRPNVPNEEEILRLTEVQSRIAKEPQSARSALGHELLEIIKDPGVDPGRRGVAAIIISGYANELNLLNSNGGYESLLSVLHSEFFIERRWIGLCRRKTQIRGLNMLTFTFLSGLIAALIAVDTKKGCEILRFACENVREPEFKAHLSEFAKRKGVFPSSR